MKNRKTIIALIIIIGVVLCSDIVMYYCYSKTSKHLKAYRQYKEATEALLDDISKDISLEDTYLCGDAGCNYYNAVIKLDSLNEK